MSGFRDGSGLENIGAFRWRDAGGLHTAGTIRYRDAGNVLRIVYNSASSAVASPESVQGYASTNGLVYITTPYTTASLTRGTPASYVWNVAGGDFVAVSPTSASTIFRTTNTVGPGDIITDTASCTITDTLGRVSVTNPVSLSANNLGA